MYSVTEEQLDNAYSIGSRQSLLIGIAGALVGAFISLFLTLLFTSELSAYENAALIAAIIATGVLSVMLWILAYMDMRQRDKQLKRLKGQNDPSARTKR